MRIEIFTEDSGTTTDRDQAERVDEYFKGRFRNVENFAGDLEEHGTVRKHIISDEFGYVLGGDSTSDLEPAGKQEFHHEFGKAILEAAKSADVIIILLTSSKFEDIVADMWGEIIDNAKRGSIWCIGVSRSAISAVDLEQLRSISQEVIFYERVGVARISSEYKEKLLDTLNDGDDY